MKDALGGRRHRKSIASSRGGAMSVCQAVMAGTGVQLVLGVRTWGCLRSGAQGGGSLVRVVRFLNKK